MADSIDSYTINMIFGNGILNPRNQSTSNPRIILVEIRKIRKTTVLNIIGVIPIRNLAFLMVVGTIVEGSYQMILFINISNMVSYHIYHDPNVLFMRSFNQINKVLLNSKVRIDIIPVKCGISMIIVAIVFHNRRYPNCVESKTRNIIQLILEPFKGSSAIFVDITTALS